MSETITLTVPTGRGKTSRSAKPWAKTVDSIERNAQSGRDWNGEWLTQGQDAEVALGDIIVVSDVDGEGACVYVAAKVVQWDGPAAKVGRKTKFFMVGCDGSKKWGANLAAATRKLLAMSQEERAAEVDRRRRVEMTENRAKAAAVESYKFGGSLIPSAEALARFDAMLAFEQVPVDPKADAIAKIKALMTEHGITITDLQA